MGKTKLVSYTKEDVWKVNLIALWLSQLCINMGYGLALPFIPYHLEAMGNLTADELSFYTGLSSSIPAAAMAIASPFWGKMSDRYGRKSMLIRAIVCGSIALFFMGAAKSIPMFMVFRVFQGFFTGSFPASMALVSANTPDKNLSQAIGFMTSSSFLGYAIGPVIGGFLCNYFSYTACFYIGTIINTMGLVVCIVVKELPGTYGKELIEERKRKKAEGKNTGGMMSAGVLLILVTVLFMRLSRTVFQPFIPLYVREVLGGMDGATTYIGILNGAVCVTTAVASVTIARLGDKYDKFSFTAVLTTIALAFTVVICFNMPLWWFIIGYGAYFFFIGAVEPVATSAASEIVDPGVLGVLFGWLNTVSSLGQMFAPMVGTALSVAMGTREILIAMPAFTLLELITTLALVAYAKKKRAVSE